MQRHVCVCYNVLSMYGMYVWCVYYEPFSVFRLIVDSNLHKRILNGPTSEWKAEMNVRMKKNSKNYFM